MYIELEELLRINPGFQINSKGTRIKPKEYLILDVNQQKGTARRRIITKDVLK